MRRLHQATHSRAFAVRYWGVVIAVLAVPMTVVALSAAGRGTSPLAALATPWVLAVGVAGLLAWRWHNHQVEVTADAVVERRHPLIWYTRRRMLHEITEAVLCPPDRRGLEHGASALLLRCGRPERDLVIAPANSEQFLDDLHAAEPALQRYRGRVTRATSATP